MKAEIIKDSKETMIANLLVTVSILALGIAIVSSSGLDELSYVAVGLIAGAVKVKIN